jgi:uncharacterized damage-inducible protein DinB
MITPAHAQLMSRYNSWQNKSIYKAADTLSDDARRADRGAFWSSIHGTLNHILWGDQIWMSRFAGLAAPAAHNRPNSSFDLSTWDGLGRERAAFDEIIEGWAGELTSDWLAAEQTWYSGAAKRDVTRPAWMLVTHFFNHQTHHRGQVHGMLTQCGAKPDDTDLFLMPD